MHVRRSHNSSASASASAIDVHHFFKYSVIIDNLYHHSRLSFFASHYSPRRYHRIVFILFRYEHRPLCSHSNVSIAFWVFFISIKTQRLIIFKTINTIHFVQVANWFNFWFYCFEKKKKTHKWFNSLHAWKWKDDHWSLLWFLVLPVNMIMKVFFPHFI